MVTLNHYCRMQIIYLMINQIARSYAIFVLRIEEIQKINVLFRIFMEKENNKKFTKEDKVYYSKFFLSHTLKIKAAAV